MEGKPAQRRSWEDTKQAWAGKSHKSLLRSQSPSLLKPQWSCPESPFIWVRFPCWGIYLDRNIFPRNFYPEKQKLSSHQINIKCSSSCPTTSLGRARFLAQNFLHKTCILSTESLHLGLHPGSSPHGPHEGLLTLSFPG